MLPLKNKDSNLDDPLASRTWVDDNWSRIVDLINNIGGEVEVKTFFLARKWKLQKKNASKIYTLTTV